MSLASGTRVGSYDVVAPLGAGGMGEVYRARDAKLNRDVAIKVLPELFALDRDRLARFEREAQVLAALNHPNIAHVYGVLDNPPALVMELVEGEDLSQVIARGAVPIAQALALAKQIAEALEAAHEKGIIHRDLKPANIKVREDGTVKVLDFGLAKAFSPDTAAEAADAMNSPTLTMRATQLGLVLGTAAYMAPEQARGKAVDRRADVWAFGVVLYEMLTGRRAFDGGDVSTTLAGVLKDDVDWQALPAELPPAARRLLRRCLEKEPRRRLSAIGDARLEVEEALVAPAETSGAAIPAAPHAHRPGWRTLLLAGAAAAAVGALAWTIKPSPVATQAVARFEHVLPDGQVFTRTGRHVVTISPDGTTIAYIANEQIYLRRLDQLSAQPVRGTQQDPIDLVFSPDGQWLAYTVTTSDGVALRKAPMAGGSPVTLAAIGSSFGMSWRDGRIAIAQNTSEGNAVVVVPENGGAPERLVAVEPDEGSVAQPYLLHDGEHVLFVIVPPEAAWDEGQIVVQRLDGTGRRVLVAGGADPKLLPTGHLVYYQGGTVFSVPVDRKRLELTGGPVPLLDGVAGGAPGHAAQFDVSTSGTLVYWPGLARLTQDRQLVWVDRQGRQQPVDAPRRPYNHPRVSPDGRRVLVDIYDDAESNVWVWDDGREILARLTFAGSRGSQRAIWTPDGREVIFNARSAAGAQVIFRQAADGSGAARAIVELGGVPEALSPEGSHLVLRTGGAHTFALSILPLQGESAATPLLADSTQGMLNAALSPDGRWLAYQSIGSGPAEIYVRSFPDVQAGRWQISSGGGTRPAWSRNGRELYFQSAAADGARAQLMATAVEPGSSFSWSKPVPLFDLAPYFTYLTGRAYDPAPDGRFLMVGMAAESAPGAQHRLHIVTNWFAELQTEMKAR